jgi:hypothetical protein
MAPSDSTSVQNNYIIEEPLAAFLVEVERGRRKPFGCSSTRRSYGVVGAPLKRKEASLGSWCRLMLWTMRKELLVLFVEAPLQRSHDTYE